MMIAYILTTLKSNYSIRSLQCCIGVQFLLDMAKRAVLVGSGSVRVGSGRVRFAGQNGSFLNGSIGLQVKRVAG